MRKLLFIGPLCEDAPKRDGVSIRNIYLKRELSNYFDVEECNTFAWKKQPFCLLIMLFKLFCYSETPVVFSLNTTRAYLILKVIHFFRLKRSIYYFVAGGEFVRMVQDGRIKKSYYERLSAMILQGQKMRDDLLALGFKNVFYAPNIRPMIVYERASENLSSVTRFLFLSRIHRDKGCDKILKSVSILNKRYKGHFLVDFYGTIEDSYKYDFLQTIEEIENVRYCGYLDTCDSSSYKLLSSYQVLLFPTNWEGEGFPGVLVDAMIAGLPVIASDWNMNREVIEEGKTGWILPENDEKTLSEYMENILNNKYNLKSMRAFCMQKAKEFAPEKVVSQDFLNSIGLLQ